MKRVVKAVILTVERSLVAGCSTSMLTVPPGPHASREGFRDGCDSGYAAAGNALYRRVEDPEKTASNDEYRLGWTSGFAECQANFRRVQRTFYAILGP